MAAIGKPASEVQQPALRVRAAGEVIAKSRYCTARNEEGNELQIALRCSNRDNFDFC